MIKQSLWRVSISVPPLSDDAVADVMERVLGVPAVAVHNLRTNRSTVSCFFRRKPRWTETAPELRRALKNLARCGVPMGAATPRLVKLRAADWANSWKRHFRPLNIAGKLLIKPSWSKARARPGQAVVVLDPGLSFGTGHHPTTRFCLEALAGFRKEELSQSMLDIGTGSGILAIAAAKLGYSPVNGFDLDRDSLRVARDNAGRNRIGSKVGFSSKDLRQFRRRRGERFSIVCANLISNLLIEESDRLAALVGDNGRLVLAGVLTREFEQVRRAYKKVGMRLLRGRSEREWRSGIFAR